MVTPGPIVVIGVGNDFRTDDGVGLYVARAIARMNLPAVRVIAGVADGSNILAAWTGADAAFIIDCAVSGAAPGTIFRFNPLKEEIPAEFFSHFSTHAINLVDTVALGRILGILPTTLTIFAIEGESFSPGPELTYKVKTAADMVVAELAKAIESVGTSNDQGPQ